MFPLVMLVIIILLCSIVITTVWTRNTVDNKWVVQGGGCVSCRADKLQQLHEKLSRLMQYLDRHQTFQKLREAYHDGMISETYMFESDLATTINKTDIRICLRDKDTNNEDALMFVALHELAHVQMDSWSHNEAFWETFRQLREHAQRAGVYTEIPDSGVRFCGTTIDHTYK